jgi:hypothetical protein
MAAEAKREPGLLRRWLQKLRESWRRAGAIDQRADKARRTYENKADKYGPRGRSCGRDQFNTGAGPTAQLSDGVSGGESRCQVHIFGSFARSTSRCSTAWAPALLDKYGSFGGGL